MFDKKSLDYVKAPKRHSSFDRVSSHVSKDQKMQPIGVFQCLLKSHEDNLMLYRIEIDDGYIQLTKEPDEFDDESTQAEPILYNLS